MVLLCPAANQLQAQASPVNAIDGAIKAGDAAAVSRWFGQSVDITINNSTSTYSRTQAELVLRDFFSRNAVRDFDIHHSGASTAGGDVYTIGLLSTDGGKYNVYLALRQKDGSYILKEIRFAR